MEFNIKHGGQVFTPDYLVNNILDIAGYGCTQEILKKHVIDNSCGDGAFLCEIVYRYCTVFLDQSSDLIQLKSDLETFVHGIEIDGEAYRLCIDNLNNLAEHFSLKDIKWDILNEDTLSVNKFDGIMDYVIGNPPYVRVHNLDNTYDSVKHFTFANGGMTDLFLVFFEIGFKMLNETGKLCYITPSSWLNSVAGSNMRDYVYRNRNMKAVVDLAHYQPFKATTYTLISLFYNNQKFEKFDYFSYDSEKLDKKFEASIDYDLSYIDGIFYLGSLKSLKDYKSLRSGVTNKYVTVKNGFATLADKVFIADSFEFHDFLIPCIKASTGVWYKAFFPYDTNGKPLSKELIFSKGKLAEYLESKKEDLLKEKPESACPEWYLYGRTQALKDVFEDKLAINACVKDIKSIKLNLVPKGSGLYSGLYILSKADFGLIRKIILSDEFIEYLKLLKKYKSGGYYTFNSKELELFINYKLTQYFKKNDKSRISTGCIEFF